MESSNLFIQYSPFCKWPCFFHHAQCCVHMSLQQVYETHHHAWFPCWTVGVKLNQSVQVISTYATHQGLVKIQLFLPKNLGKLIRCTAIWWAQTSYQDITPRKKEASHNLSKSVSKLRDTFPSTWPAQLNYSHSALLHFHCGRWFYVTSTHRT